MPNIFDIFSQDAFNLMSLTAAINKVPYTPTRLRELGIFEAEGVNTTHIAIEELSGALKLVQTSERGGPGKTRHEGRRTVRTLTVPHLCLTDHVLADTLQNLRAFGSDNMLTTIQDWINARITQLRQDIEATQENLRLGAIRGTILDADGSSIYNLFTEFGVTQLDEVNFALGTATTDVRGKCQTLRRNMSKELGALSNGGFRIHALCSPEFFDALISHDTVKEVYKNWTAAAALAEDKTYTAFSFGGITFEDYRGTDDGSSIVIAANKAHFFPIVSGLFKEYFAPADYVEAVNTIGLPFYVQQTRDPKDKFIDLEVQSNPLPICLRPRTLIQGKKS